MLKEIKLDFSKWITENATTSGDVAVFARPIFSQPFKRNDIDPLLNEKKKKKQKRSIDFFCRVVTI